MKLATLIEQGDYRLGVKTDAGIFHVQAALQAVKPEGGSVLPTSVQEVIAGGREAVAALEAFMKQVGEQAETPSVYWRDEASLVFGPCVTHPNKIICVGLNYRRHAEETNAPIPASPILFNKFNNALAGHGEEIALPAATEQADYEAELAIVIGKTAKNVSEPEARAHMFGYCCANDLSARDLQMRTSQWLLGKSCDKFAPLGPYLVTADEVGNPNRLDIRCTVNGEMRQHSNTSDLIFDCDEIVSYISRHMTLVPGDIILTGTPEGVVLGYPEDKRQYLRAGDVVTIEIEKLGTLTNRMVAE